MQKSPQANLILASSRPSRLVFGAFTIDAQGRQLSYRGEHVELVGKAFDVLAALVAADGAALSRTRLHELVWGDGAVEDGNLSQCIYLIRKALTAAGGRRCNDYIQTLPRHGYRLAVPTSVADEVTLYRRPWMAPLFAALVAVVSVIASATPVHISEPLDGQAAVDYALGRYFLDLRTPRDLQSSIRYFKLIMRHRPASAVGYAGAASAYALEAEYQKAGSQTYDDDVATASHLAHDALAREPSSPSALAVAGFLAYRFENDDTLAARDLQEAVSRNPNDSEARHWYAIWLFSHGQISAAEMQWQTAHEESPTSEIIARWLGRAYYYDNKPEAALRTLSEALSLEPQDAPALLAVASADEQLGRVQEAYDVLRRVDRAMPYERPFTIPDELRLRAKLRPGSIAASQLREIVRLASAGRLDRGESALLLGTVKDRTLAKSMLTLQQSVSRIQNVMDEHDPRYKILQR